MIRKTIALAFVLFSLLAAGCGTMSEQEVRERSDIPQSRPASWENQNPSIGF